MKNYLLFAALLLGIFLAGTSPAVYAQTGGTMKVKIYLPKDDTDGNVELVAVERTVKRTGRVADTAVRELLKGADETDRKNGLISYYEVKDIIKGGECQTDKMKPLGAYLIGVTIKKGKATVNFRPEAECYLQSAVTMMNFVMNPIEKTLMQFPSVKEVQYALNGEIITEWDA